VRQGFEDIEDPSLFDHGFQDLPDFIAPLVLAQRR